MSTPGKQQQQHQQHVGGASGRGQSSTPSRGTGRGGVQQASRGRRGRKSKKNITPPRFSRKPDSVVPAAANSLRTNEEASIQQRVPSSSGKWEKSSEPLSTAMPSVAGTDSLQRDTSGGSREGLQLEAPPVSALHQTDQQLDGACSLSLSGSSPALGTALPTATAEPLPPPHAKEKGEVGRTVGLSDTKSEDFGVARRLLNFTRGPGDREAEPEGEVGEGKGREGGGG